MNRDNIIIEAEELLARLDDPNIRIYDATILFFMQDSDLTAHATYLQGHIPGAAFFDHQDFSDPNSEYEYTLASEAVLAAQIGKIGISADSEVIFYTSRELPCATRAWWILHYAGHDNVRILNGGLAAWKQAGGEIEQEDRHYAPSKFEGHFNPNLFASLEEVRAAAENGKVCLEFTIPPIMYGNAYIPGSEFLSCMDLMHDMAALVSGDEIASRLQEGAQYDRIITYCGGGIAATVNALAHLIAGNENVAVYDGSLVEWMGEGMPTEKADMAQVQAAFD